MDVVTRPPALSCPVPAPGSQSSHTRHAERAAVTAAATATAAAARPQ